jgi:hypothetical protein
MAIETSSQISASDVEKAAISQMENIDNVDLKAENEPDLPPMDPAALKKLTRKCDLYVVPPLFILFLLAFLDRTNIGNAKIQGLEAGLGLSGTEYNIALFIFFIPYILFEVPSNILLKKIAPSTWLSSIMVCWGKSDLLKWQFFLLTSSRYRNHGARTYQRLSWYCCNEIRPGYFRSRPVSRSVPPLFAQRSTRSTMKPNMNDRLHLPHLNVLPAL